MICLAKPPRRTVGHRRACEVCVHELGTLLDELDDRLPLLPDMLIPGGQPSSVRLARDASPAPLRVDVLALLDERGDLGVLAVLQPFADVLAAERNLSGQVDPITSLRAHLEWVAAADWVGAFAKVLRRIGAEVRRVLGEAPRPVATCRREVGTRVEVRDGERVEVSVECRGTITASAYSDTATCQRCGDVWERARWQHLGRLQDEAINGRARPGPDRQETPMPDTDRRRLTPMSAAEIGQLDLVEIIMRAPLDQAVTVAVGRASTCWSSMDGTGVFDDNTAIQIVHALLSRISAELAVGVADARGEDTTRALIPTVAAPATTVERGQCPEVVRVEGAARHSQCLFLAGHDGDEHQNGNLRWRKDDATGEINAWWDTQVYETITLGDLLRDHDLHLTLPHSPTGADQAPAVNPPPALPQAAPQPAPEAQA